MIKYFSSDADTGKTKELSYSYKATPTNAVLIVLKRGLFIYFIIIF